MSLPLPLEIRVEGFGSDLGLGFFYSFLAVASLGSKELRA